MAYRTDQLGSIETTSRETLDEGKVILQAHGGESLFRGEIIMDHLAQRKRDVRDDMNG